MAAKKPIPKSILIFGANNHIGGPLAEFIHQKAPEIKLRLATTKAENVEALQQKYPYGEAVCASYLDYPSLEKAVEGMEGIFVVSTTGTDEKTAMTNLVNAVKKADCVVHIQRILGLIPMSNPYAVPESMKKHGIAQEIQHTIAKDILDASGLPVTYLNIGATMMDNFFKMKKGLKEQHKLIWHNRLIPYIDPKEIGEVAACLFLSDNAGHIGVFHTLNNGQDRYTYDQVCEIMTEVFGVEITPEDSYEGFEKEYGNRFGPRLPMVWEMFEYEKANGEAWYLSDFVERTIGHRPKSLREWLEENKELLMG